MCVFVAMFVGWLNGGKQEQIRRLEIKLREECKDRKKQKNPKGQRGVWRL